MDQIKTQKFHSCAQHSKKKLKFIQVNEVKYDADSNIFYCTDCINEDMGFQAKNYLLVEQIIQKGENSIIQKWPPVNDYSLIEKLSKETTKFDQSQHIIQRITNYFTELKNEIIRKMEFYQIKMINHAQNLPFGKSQILKQYQQISQISQLRSLIIEGQNDKQFYEQLSQDKFKNFINQVGIKKDQNTQQLQKLLDQSIKQKYLINYELPNMIKEQILSFIDKINFFNDDILSTQNLNHGNRSESQKETNFSTKILSLISNKSNFCSAEFLNQIKLQLEKLNPLFEDIPTQNMFIQGKKPIEFQQLTEQKMNEINEHVKHLIQLQKNVNYQTEMQSSQFIKDIQKIMQNKFNFISENSQKTIINHLTESFSYLKIDGNTQIIQQSEKFELFNLIDQQMIDDLFLLIKQKQQFGNSMNNSHTIKIKNFYKFNQFKKGNLDRIFSSFPIFDLIPLNEVSILNDLQFVKGTFNDGDKRISIKQNKLNQYEITINEDQYTGDKSNTYANCISNIILEKDKKYIFRVQIQNKNNNSKYFQIGFMQQKNINIQEGFKDYQYAQFKQENNKIKLQCIYFNNYLKANDLQIPGQSAVFELRVWLNEKILQISDFPNNNFIVSINNQQLEQLQNLEDLSLFFQLYSSNQNYILTEALMVEEFDN